MSHYGNELRDKLIALELVNRYEFIGCTASEIEDAMAAQNVTFLPRIYREFLETMGRRDAGFLCGERTYPYIKDNKNSLEDIIDGNNEFLEKDFHLPEDAFVFINDSGHFYFYFCTATENDNPPVYCFFDDEQGADREPYASLIEFFEAHIKQRCHSIGKRYPRD